MMRVLLVALPLLLLVGCLNSIDEKQISLPDGSLSVTVITSHMTPFNDSASFSAYRCSTDPHPVCAPAWANPASAPGALGGVANGLGSTAVQSAAPFLAPRIIQNQKNGDTQ